MRLPDFLKFVLYFLNRLIFEVFNFLQCVLNNSECLRVNFRSRQQLVDLGVLGLEAFLNGF